MLNTYPGRGLYRAVLVVCAVFLLQPLHASPVFVNITPNSGPPGTVVAVTMNGLDTAAPHSVSIDGVAGNISSVTATQLVFTAGPGSTSGELVVTEGGIHFTNPFPFEITRAVAGIFAPPPGVSVQGYTITAWGDSTNINGSGQFTAILPTERQVVVWACRGEGDPVFLAVVPPATNQILIDARSTAAAWAFLSPLVGTPDPVRGQAILAHLMSRPQTDSLADRIASLCAGGADYQDDARFESDLMALMDAYLSSPAPLSRKRTSALEPGTPQGAALKYLNPTNPPAIPSRKIKTQILPPSSGSPGYQMKFDSESGGNRLDWFVEVYALDPDQFSEGFANVDRLLPSDRPRKLSFEPVGSAYVKGDLFSAKFDLTSWAAGKVTDLVYGPSLQLNTVSLPPNTPGVYVSQAYSGNIWYGTTIFFTPPLSQSDTLDLLNANTQWGLALAGNVFTATVDGLSAAFPIDNLVNDPQLKTKILYTIAVDVSKALSGHNKGFFTSDSLLEVLKTSTTSILKAAIAEALSDPKKVLSPAFAVGSLKVFGKALDILGRYSAISQSLERFSGVGTPYALALERSVAVIGTPWAPRITSFFPSSGRGGEILTIQATRFDPDTNTLRAGFSQFSSTDDPSNVTARLDLEIISVNAGNIAVRIPTNALQIFPNGRAYVFIESGSNHLVGASASLNPPFREFNIRPFPTITSVTPNPVQTGGTLELQGYGFDSFSARDHQIVIDGTTQAFGFAATESNLVVVLPASVQPGNHELTLALRGFTTPSVPFQVQAPAYTPVLGQGFGITVTLNDFSDNPDDGQISVLEAIRIARGERQPRQHDPCELLPPDDPSACPFVEREVDHVSGSSGGAGVVDIILFPNDMIIAGPLPALSEGDRYIFGSPGHPVVLDGSGAGSGADGVLLDGASAVFVSGYLVIQNFSGNGVHLRNGANENFFEDLQIRNCGAHGVFLDGNASFNEFRHTSISNATGNGFYLSGADVRLNRLTSFKGTSSEFGEPSPYDVIAACGGDGIRLDNGTSFNAINPGTIRNCGGAGISISGTGTQANRVGRDDDLLARSYDLVGNGGPGAYLGPGAVGNVLRYLNPIGNQGDGVLLEGAGCSNNIVDRTFAGLNRYELSTEVTIANQGSGIHISNGAQFNLIGAVSQSIGEHGTLVGNRDDGLLIDGTNTAFNVVNAQNIGVINPFTSLFLYKFAPNGGAAIALRDGAHDNVIGDQNLSLANTIFASPVGIEIAGNRTDYNHVLGNCIGTFFATPNWVVGSGEALNGIGIWIHDGPRGNIIGFPGAVTLVPRVPNDPYPDHYRTFNSIESCTNAGVLIENASGQLLPDGTVSSPNVVQGNLIGELESGSLAPSGATGIKLGAGAEANWIGGSTPEKGNRIRGWTRAGIWIDQNNLPGSESRNRIENNYIEGPGIIANQTSYLTQTPPGGVGLLVTESSGHVFGESAQTANRLQYNRVAVYLGDSSSNTVRGFYITNNFNSGIAIRGGGENLVEGNRIHAIGLNGAQPWAAVALSSTSGNRLRANEVGYLAPGRGSVGLLITNAHENTVGGAPAADGNLILDGVTNAVVLTGSGTFGNKLFNNLIGQDRTPAVRANKGDGVRVENGAHDNFIGGEAQLQAGAALLNVPAGNIIAHNDGAGVRVSGATSLRNRILFNSITGNGAKGIVLESGGNSNVPPPLMVKVDGLQASGIVTNLGVVPPGSIIQVFSNPILHRIDEGDRFVGEGVVTTNGTWRASLAAPGIPPFTMTATDTNGSTSEFGAGVTNFEAFVLARTDNQTTDTAPDGAIRLPVLRLTALASNVDVVVDTLTLEASGTLPEPSGVATVELFRDVNGDGKVGIGDSQLAGPISFMADNGTVAFTNLNISIPSGGSQRWIVAYSLNSGAALGANFQLRVTDAESVPSHLAAQFGVPVYPSGPFPLNSAQFTISAVQEHTFALWQQDNFSPEQLTDPDISGPAADPDGDGIANLLEYAFHLDPWVIDAESDARNGAGLPVPGRMSLFVPELGGLRDFFTVTYVRLKAAGDLAYALQESADLNSWLSQEEAPGDFSVVSETDVQSDPAYEIVVIRSTTPLPGPDEPSGFFYRVRVTWSP